MRAVARGVKMKKRMLAGKCMCVGGGGESVAGRVEWWSSGIRVVVRVEEEQDKGN